MIVGRTFLHNDGCDLIIGARLCHGPGLASIQPSERRRIGYRPRLFHTIHHAGEVCRVIHIVEPDNRLSKMVIRVEFDAPATAGIEEIDMEGKALCHPEAIALFLEPGRTEMILNIRQVGIVMAADKTTRLPDMRGGDSFPSRHPIPSSADLLQRIVEAVHFKGLFALELQDHGRMVLQVTADAGQPDLGRDAGRLQMVFRADAGPQQYLRRIYGPAGQNHLAPGPCGAGNAAMTVMHLIRPVAPDADMTHRCPCLHCQIAACACWLQICHRRAAPLAIADRGVKAAQPFRPVAIQIL